MSACLAPSPLWGEGWGEGPAALIGSAAGPHPNPPQRGREQVTLTPTLSRQWERE